MDWDRLFREKEGWQRNTFDRIKNDLFSAQNSHFMRYDNAAESHLVMIYGKSQVGKTTLILNMIGIRDECFNEVYETLRAGIARGNSSTSTAIIYSKSESDQYGCSFKSLNDHSLKMIEYYDKEEMIRHLNDIRQWAESNRIGTDNILHIAIPQKYFVEDSTINLISIMDMPGVESRNHKEDVHVQNLMKKYIPISSVCIIACTASDIVSLENTTLFDRMDWKRMSHRFVLVITYAYINGTTKQYFGINRTDRKKAFYDYVKEEYTREIRKILGNENTIEVFPVDVGYSLGNLCTEEINNKEDVKEIYDTKNHIFEDLRWCIVSHKGERLKSALEDLKSYSRNYEEDLFLELNQEIEINEEKIKDIEFIIKQTEEYKEELICGEDQRDEISRTIFKLERTQEELDGVMYGCITCLSEEAKKYIIANDLYKDSRKGPFLKDKNKEVQEYVREYISMKTDEYIFKIKGVLRKACITIEVKEAAIKSDMDKICVCTIEEEKLYPEKRGLFSKKKKVYLDHAERIFDQIGDRVNSALEKYVSDYKSIINETITRQKNEISIMDQKISTQDRIIHERQKDIELLREKIEDSRKVKEDIEWQREQDQNTLDMYLKYAEEAYIEQREDIIHRINECTEADGKTMLLLLLGLVDKDFRKVTGGIHEYSH